MELSVKQQRKSENNKSIFFLFFDLQRTFGDEITADAVSKYLVDRSPHTQHLSSSRSPQNQQLKRTS